MLLSASADVFLVQRRDLQKPRRGRDSGSGSWIVRSREKMIPDGFHMDSTLPMPYRPAGSIAARERSFTMHPDFWGNIYSPRRNSTFSGSRRNPLITK